MELQKLYNFITEERLGEASLQEPLYRYTTWRIGGPADLFYQPADIDACAGVLSKAYQKKIPVTFLGAGSNVLVADEGIKGLVIQTKRLNSLLWQENRITAGAGISLLSLSKAAGERALSGLEFAVGIPGTLGGAAVINAGAHGASLGEIVEEVRTVSKSGKIQVYTGKQLRFDYRTSVLKGKDELVVEVTLALKSGNYPEIKNLMDEYTEFRREKQPIIYPNTGSVFKNPQNDSAGRLIDAAGLKGWRIGDAQVSVEHANFIVNLGQARACEVLELIKGVRETVKKKFSVQLETEVVILGFDDNRR